jgi:TRAP-type uncharacterized transport system substrate-binding protein
MPRMVPPVLKRPWLRAVVVGVVVLAAGVYAVAALEPLPPRTLRLATGPEGSAYAELGRGYQAALAREGITLELVPTAGSLENVRLLDDAAKGVSVAFVQGGTVRAPSPHVHSLGTLFYEPLWFFVRSSIDLRPGLAEALHGRRVAVGAEGSGSRALALELLAKNGIGGDFAQLTSDAPRDVEVRLLSGELDAAILVSSWDAPAVQHLLASDAVELLSFPRADAYVALDPHLSKLIVPQGVGNLATNRPAADVQLVAPKASLAVRDDLHPALQYLLLDAATELHSAPRIFQRAGEFRAAQPDDFPLSKTAQHYFKSGRPLLQRTLPFWLATFVEQLLLLLVPIIGVVYPLLRVAPALWAWGMRRRIFHLYGELRMIEAELDGQPGLPDPRSLEQRLDALETRASRLRVTTAYHQSLYTLRLHIGLVRQRLERRVAKA